MCVYVCTCVSIRSDVRLHKDDVDICFSKTLNSCKVPQIRYASVERLLERLTDLRFLSIDFLNTFLHTYRIFTTATVVMDKLADIYKKPFSSIPIRSLTLNMQMYTQTKKMAQTQMLMEAKLCIMCTHNAPQRQKHIIIAPLQIWTIWIMFLMSMNVNLWVCLHIYLDQRFVCVYVFVQVYAMCKNVCRLYVSVFGVVISL